MTLCPSSPKTCDLSPSLCHSCNPFHVSAGSRGMMCRPTELFLLSIAERNKDLSCTSKMSASQTGSWDRENALCRQCAKCCTATFCVTVREQNDRVQNWSWGYVRRMLGVTGRFWMWLNSALPSLVWETAEVLHMKSHPSSHTVSMHRYLCASVCVAWDKHLAWRMSSQSVQIWWTFKQQNTESYNGG